MTNYNVLHSARQTFFKLSLGKAVILLAFCLFFSPLTYAASGPTPTSSPSVSARDQISLPMKSVTVTTQSEGTVTVTSDNVITSIVELNNMLYIGGNFREITVGEVSVERLHLVQYDLVNDQFTGWNPEPNEGVEAVATDESTIYVGGFFTRIAGVERRYIAAFDAATGEILPWSPDVTEPVKDIYIDDSTVYLSRAKNPNRAENNYVVAYNTQENTLTYYASPTPTPPTRASAASVGNGGTSPEATAGALMVNKSELGFKIPTLADILTFVIRAFFILAGLMALFYLLMGAFAWITSGGDKDKISQARSRITSTVVGMVVMVAVLAIAVTMEQVVFQQNLCFGLTCPASIPTLLEST